MFRKTILTIAVTSVGAVLLYAMSSSEQQSPSAHDYTYFRPPGQSQPTQHTPSPQLVAAGTQLMAPENAEDAATRQLIEAAGQGQMDEVIQALEAGARIDENRASFVGIGRQSPLLAATLLGHHHIVRVLLERGADPTIAEKDGYTVWHAAAFQGRTEVLRVLHELEVPGYAPSESDGYSPLHRAAWGSSPGHVEAVKFLIGPAGRPCNVVAADGQTPLQMAVHKDTITALKACMDAAE